MQVAGPVALSVVSAQLEQLMAAAKHKVDAERQLSHAVRTLNYTPNTTDLVMLQPYLRDAFAIVDIADNCWQRTLQSVLMPLTNTRTSAIETQSTLLDTHNNWSTVGKRLRSLESNLTRAEQVRQIIAGVTDGFSPYRSARLCDACFSIAHCAKQLDETQVAHMVVVRTSAVRALSRELAAPCCNVYNCNDACFQLPKVRMPWEAAVTSVLSTDCRGEAFVETRFTFTNLNPTVSIRLEELRVKRTDTGSCHTIDLARTALLLPHTKPEPSYSVYVLVVPLSQLCPSRTSFATDETDAAALNACSQFAKRGARGRFGPRWPRYEFTWRFQEVPLNEPGSTVPTAAASRGIWAYLGL